MRWLLGIHIVTDEKELEERKTPDPEWMSNEDYQKYLDSQQKQKRK